MNSVLLGFKRLMLPIPWSLFIRIVPKAVRKTKRILGGLNEEQRKVHRFVVSELPRLGQSMSPEYVSSALEMNVDKVIQILDDLERRLIFVCRSGGRNIIWAYPVTAEPTPHRLDFSSGERFWAA